MHEIMCSYLLILVRLVFFVSGNMASSSAILSVCKVSFLCRWQLSIIISHSRSLQSELCTYVSGLPDVLVSDATGDILFHVNSKVALVCTCTRCFHKTGLFFPEGDRKVLFSFIFYCM